MSNTGSNLITSISPLERIPRVLIVDDDESVPVFFHHDAHLYGYNINFVYAGDVGEAVELLNEVCCDAAIIDVILKGVTGVSLAQEIRKHDPLIPLAYYTNLDCDNIKAQAREHNALFLNKSLYQMSDEGHRELMSIVNELAYLNPCLPGGIRIDSQGFPRQIPTTPIKMSEPFMKLLNQSRSMVRAA